MNQCFQLVPDDVLFQFKNGKLAWVERTQLSGLRLGITYDYSLGCDVWYQL